MSLFNPPTPQTTSGSWALTDQFYAIIGGAARAVAGTVLAAAVAATITSGTLARGYILPTDSAYGAVGDGIFNPSTPGTNDYTALQAAMDAARAGNVPLNLGGKGYYIGRNELAFTTAGNLTIVGPGIIYWSRGNVGTFRFEPALGVEKNVSGFVSSVVPTNTAHNSSTPVTYCTVASGDEDSFSKGEVVIVHSTDLTLMDNVSGQLQRGEMANITSIDTVNHRIYLNLLLKYTFTTAAKIIKIDQTSKLRVYGGVKFRCVDDCTATIASLGGVTTGGRGKATFIVAGANEPNIEVEVDNAPNRAIMLVGCYRAKLKADVWRIADFNTDNAYGYGVSVAGCSRHCEVTVFGGYLRHAYTTNAYPGGSAAWKGGPRDIKIMGDVARTGATSWDTHLECFDQNFWDITSDGNAPDDINTDQASRYFFQDRGVDTVVKGANLKNFPNGFYIYPCDPGYNYVAKYSGLTFSAGTAENTVLGSNQLLMVIAANGAGPAGRMRVEIADSYVANMAFSLAATQPVIRFNNVTFVDMSLMRHNASTNAEYWHCSRINTTGSAQEPIAVTAGGTIKAYHMHFQGLYTNSCCFRKTDGSGTAVLEHAFISGSGGVNAVWTSAGGTFTVTQCEAGILTGSATYNPASLVDAAGATTTVTVTGAALGDFVEALSFSLDLQGITLTGWVSAANTVSVRFQNESGGTLDLASGTIRARVRRA